ncbi:MAG: hypothetical protein F6J98_47220 [Moorea sp. SIO4G2]|nr:MULTISPECIES: hypothetical protein [unclassified Moorena]NEO16561.1 hypothetical protein [Moorena sp. SIO3E8]NEO67540.1 hypothetical protein [Moorena sp. SIO4G2]NEQ03091.1 hypothetical protein [Moorena sp. SIO3F7]
MIKTVGAIKKSVIPLDGKTSRWVLYELGLITASLLTPVPGPKTGFQET